MLKITYIKLTLIAILIVLGNYLISKISEDLIKILSILIVNLILTFYCFNFKISNYPKSYGINDMKKIQFIVIGLFSLCLFSYSITALAYVLLYGNQLLISNTPSSIIILITQIILFPITEELLYRKSIGEGTKNLYGFNKGLWISSIIFSLSHLFSETGILIALIGGLFLGYIYLKTKNLLLTIICHSAFNLFSLFLSPRINSVLRDVDYNISLTTLFLFMTVGIVGLVIFIMKMKKYKLHTDDI